MNRKKVTPYWSIRVAIFILMFPLYAVAIYSLSTASTFVNPSMLGKTVFVGFIVALVLSLLILIRTAKAAIPIVLLFGGFMAVSMMNAFQPGIGANEYSLTVGKGSHIVGTDVYCNGVKLGQTPLRITDDEFYEKVKPWDKPPRQESTSIKRTKLDGDEFESGYLYWMPCDPFGNYAEWPDGDTKRPMRGVRDNTGVFKVMKDIKYWWHFENSGCVGITEVSDFVGGADGSGNKITIEATPNIRYPSLSKHFSILIESLKRSDFKASEQWLSHFQKYQDVMFLKFYNYVKKNPKAAGVLDAVVKRQFNIGSEISRTDCKRVLDEVMVRVEKVGCFTIPSVESQAVEMVCAGHKDVISEYYADSLKWAYVGGRDRRSSSDFTTYLRDGKGIRNTVMEYLVNKYQPEGLYNRLVYECARNDRAMYIAVNYRREESVKLFDHYLRKSVKKITSVFGSRHQIDRTIQTFEKITNPDLHEMMLAFISMYATDRSHAAENFFESYVKKAPQDPELAGIISNSKAIADYEKAKLIVKLRSDEVSNSLLHLSNRNPKDREKALRELSGAANPFADKFLIDCFEYYMRSDNENKSLRNWVKAVVGSNTPQMREFLTGIFEKGGKEKDRLLKEMSQGRWTNPSMDWLVPMLEKVEGGDQRYQAASILSHIASERAVAVLKTWSGDSNKKFANNAKYQLNRIKIAKNRTVAKTDGGNFDQETIDGVISGRIKPDDLLDEAIGFVWDGEKYVAEEPSR